MAESSDVPGLATEAETMEQLVAELHIIIPELLDMLVVICHAI